MVTTKIAPVCPKCGVVKKSAKLSCCAPGGAWLKNCGTSGKSNTEPWVEGVQACRDVLSLLSDNEKSQLILINQAISTRQSTDLKHQAIDSAFDSVYHDPPASNEDNDQLSHTVVFAIVLLIALLNNPT